jgi:hypothetical protein
VTKTKKAFEYILAKLQGEGLSKMLVKTVKEKVKERPLQPQGGPRTLPSSSGNG